MEPVTAAPPVVPTMAPTTASPPTGLAATAAPVAVAPPLVATELQQPAYPAPGSHAYRHVSWARVGHDRAAVAHLNTSAAVLLLVSAFAIIATGIIGIPSAVLAIMALRDRSADTSSARRKARLGWIVFAANAVVGLVLIGALLWWLRSQ